MFLSLHHKPIKLYDMKKVFCFMVFIMITVIMDSCSKNNDTISPTNPTTPMEIKLSDLNGHWQYEGYTSGYEIYSLPLNVACSAAAKSNIINGRKVLLSFDFTSSGTRCSITDECSQQIIKSNYTVAWVLPSPNKYQSFTITSPANDWRYTYEIYVFELPRLVLRNPETGETHILKKS
jgi:hypothetical protein